MASSIAIDCSRIRMQFVTTALEWSYTEEEKDVNSKHLKAAAEHLTLCHDTISVIGAKGQNDGEK